MSEKEWFEKYFGWDRDDGEPMFITIKDKLRGIMQIPFKKDVKKKDKKS